MQKKTHGSILALTEPEGRGSLTSPPVCISSLKPSVPWSRSQLSRKAFTTVPPPSSPSRHTALELQLPVPLPFSLHVPRTGATLLGCKCWVNPSSNEYGHKSPPASQVFHRPVYKQAGVAFSVTQPYCSWRKPATETSGKTSQSQA